MDASLLAEAESAESRLRDAEKQVSELFAAVFIFAEAAHEWPESVEFYTTEKKADEPSIFKPGRYSVDTSKWPTVERLVGVVTELKEAKKNAMRIISSAPHEDRVALDKIFFPKSP